MFFNILLQNKYEIKNWLENTHKIIYMTVFLVLKLTEKNLSN